MSTQPIDYDALAAQHNSVAAVDYDALAAKHGATSGSEHNPGHAPTLGDQAMESLKFAGNEALGAGKAIVAPIAAIANRITNPPDYTNTPMENPTAIGNAPIVKMASDINNQMNTGDMSGLAQNLGGIGAQAAMLKGAPEAPGAVESLADVAKLPQAAGVKAAILEYLKSQPENIPVVGKPMMKAYQAYKDATTPPPVQTAPIPPVKYMPKPQVPPVPTAAIPPVKWNAQLPEGVPGLSPELLDGVSQWAIGKTYARATQMEKIQVQRLAAKLGQK